MHITVAMEREYQAYAYNCHYGDLCFEVVPDGAGQPMFFRATFVPSYSP